MTIHSSDSLHMVVDSNGDIKEFFTENPETPSNWIKFWRDTCCFFGWHCWSWTLDRNDEDEIVIPIGDEIPDDATCIHCMSRYDTSNRRKKTAKKKKDKKDKKDKSAVKTK